MCQTISTYYRTARFNLELINYSGDHKFVQNNVAFLLANLSMSRVNLAIL